MEKQFFTWDSWDQADTAAFIFENCTLVQSIGDHRRGDTIPSVYLNFETGDMWLTTDDGSVEKYKVELSLV